MAERAPEQTGKRVTVEPARDELDSPCLEWVTIENPNDAYVLREDDYVLDSHLNPEFDSWETLVLLKPEREED